MWRVRRVKGQGVVCEGVEGQGVVCEGVEGQGGVYYEEGRRARCGV